MILLFFRDKLDVKLLFKHLILVLNCNFNSCFSNKMKYLALKVLKLLNMIKY